MSIYTSIYIPRMSVDHNEQDIKTIMAGYRIGTVSYIDFTPINKKPGFGENVDEVVKSAFIHFSDPWIASDNFYHYQSRTFMGNTTFWDTIACGQPYKLQISPKEYWLCLKNKNPIQRTMMNIHQVVENGRHLESIIEAQQKLIEEQQKQIDVLNDITYRVRDEVYQFIGGLFNQTTQRDAINFHLEMLGIDIDESQKVKGNLKCNIWPTTRQGDEHDKRIEALENKITQLLIESRYSHHARITPIFNNEEQDEYLLARKHSNNMYHDDDSISTHSSMPELEEVGSIDSDNRIRNSYELCGNE